MRRLALAAITLLHGCYLAHERGDGDRDAFVTVRDAAVARDTLAIDAAACDPGPIADPDLGPDARPSEYPEAAHWHSPPHLAETDPCCTLGDPIRAIEPASPGLPMGIDFDGSRWVAFANDSDGAHLAVLDANGTLVPGPSSFDGLTELIALQHAEGRWGALALTYTASSIARIYDDAFGAVGTWLDVDAARGLVRSTHGNQWATLGARIASPEVQPFDECGLRPAVSEQLPLDSTWIVGASRSRVVHIQHDCMATNCTGPIARVLGTTPSFPLLFTVPLAAPLGAPRADDFAAAALRDVFIVPTVHGIEVGVEVVDPFAGTVTPPTSLGTLVYDHVSAVGVAGASRSGVAGVCFAEAQPQVTSSMTHIYVDVALVDEHGSTIGAPVRVAETFTGDLVSDEACTIGTDGDGFMVGWNIGGAMFVRRVDVAH